MPYEIAPSSMPRLDLVGSVATMDPMAMGFVAFAILPMLESPLISGEFRKHTLETWLQLVNSKRGINGGTKEVNLKLTRDTFDLVEYCLKNKLDVTQQDALMRDGADEPMRIRLNNTIILRDIERDAATLLEDTGTFADNLTAIGTDWTQGAATPVDDVNYGRQKVVTATGIDPNFLHLRYEQLRFLATNAQVVGRYKGARTDIVPTFQGPDGAKALADVFEIDRVIISNARKNTANLGQTITSAAVWDTDKAMLGFHSAGDHRDVQLGRHICLSTEEFAGIGSQQRGQEKLAGLNLYIDEYGEPETKSHNLRTTRTLKGKIWEPKCATLFTGVLT